MKKNILLLVVVLLSVSASYRALANNADTTRIIHSFDGMTNEWPDTAFTTDKESLVKYAIDNNNEYLFIAMRVPEFRMQMKIGRLGMNVYFDTKGKKKESKGIEFPVKGEENASGGMRAASSSPDKQRPDKKAIRASIASNMLYMNVFGFDESGKVAQGLTMPDKANIAFSWDAADVLNIEYRIPIKLIGEMDALDQKTISIGWKINGRTMSGASEGGEMRGGGEGMRGDGGGRGGGRFGGGGGGETPDRAEMEKMMKDLSFWTKYTVQAEAVKRAF